MTDSPRSQRNAQPDAFLDSIRRKTSYPLLRMFIDVTAGITILSTIVLTLMAMGQNILFTLLTLTVSVVTTLAARMFAHLVVDIADTLQWQARKMASESDQPSA